MPELTKEFYEYYQAVKQCDSNVCLHRDDYSNIKPMVNCIIGQDDFTLDGGPQWGIPWYDNFKPENFHNLMIIGQDFGNEKTVKAFRNPESTVNDNTYQRLQLSLKSHQLLEKTYLTNIVLCARPGASKETGYLRESTRNICSERWLDKQINLVQPEVVGALGRYALEGILKFYKKELPVSSYSKIIRDRKIWKLTTSNGHSFSLVALKHPALPLKGFKKHDTDQLYGWVKSLLKD